MAPSRKLSLALALSLLASSATVNPALANPDESHVQANAHLVRDLPLHADVRHRRHHAALAARERAVAEKRDNILGGTLQGIGNVVSGLGSASNGPVDSLKQFDPHLANTHDPEPRRGLIEQIFGGGSGNNNNAGIGSSSSSPAGSTAGSGSSSNNAGSGSTSEGSSSKDKGAGSGSSSTPSTTQGSSGSSNNSNSNSNSNANTGSKSNSQADTVTPQPSTTPSAQDNQRQGPSSNAAADSSASSSSQAAALQQNAASADTNGSSAAASPEASENAASDTASAVLPTTQVFSSTSAGSIVVITSTLSAPVASDTAASGTPSNGRYDGLAGSGDQSSSSEDSSNGDKSGGISKAALIPIVVVASLIAAAIVIFTIVRKVKYNQSDRFARKLKPIDFEPTRGALAYPIGSARGQGAESLHSRDSGESFVAGRPMSGASEGSMMPPMQEVNTHPYAMPADYPFGLATGRSDGQSDSLHPQEQSLTSGRLHNYGRSAYGATDESSISHGGYNTADDEDGLYYDGSHSQGQGSRAVQGMDMAGVAVSSPRGYSPYADLQRGGSVRSASPSELTHSSDMHSEHSPYPNPHENPFEYVGGSEHERGDFGRLSPEYVMQHPQHNSSRWSG